MSELEKLKRMALDSDLTLLERKKAIELLGKIETKEATLVLLDVARD